MGTIQQYKKKYNSSKKGIITKIYNNQTASSKKRNHNPPEFSKKDLSDWLQNDWLFDLLYNNWKNCGRSQKLIPSIDRKENSKPYTLENIQVMTWAENKSKGHADIRRGDIIHGFKPQKAVVQISKDSQHIREFISIQEAARETSISAPNICSVCKKKRGHAGGFKWKYKSNKDVGEISTEINKGSLF